MEQDKINIFSRIWSSIFRGPVFPGTDKERKWAAFENLILHVHPRTVPEPTLKFTLTWGLGGMSLVLLVLQVLTGTLLLFAYEPSPEKAYSSVFAIQNDILFGAFIRNIHHWAANILVIVVFLHLLRVFFTGAFHHIRQFNWIIGLFLFFSVLLSNFTGYLLPWDQLAFWAITICTNMLAYIPGVGSWMQTVVQGGPEISSATLTIFFTIHTTAVPVILVLLLPFHFWRTRKAGGLVIPRTVNEEADSKPNMVPTIPDLVLREGVVALVLIALIFIYSIVFNAPLESPANPGMSPNPAKAPWYFLGIQEMLLHFHPLFAVFIIPVVVVCLLLLLPYMKYDSTMSGVWFHSQKGRQMGIMSAVTALIIAPAGILADEFLINIPAWVPGVAPMISNGLIPAAILFAAIAGFYVFMKKKYSASNNEAVQALFILLVVSFVVLTITGIWFRGEGMGLVLPWNR